MSVKPDEAKISSDLLRGHTDTMILKLLVESDRYGYEIVKLISEISLGNQLYNFVTVTIAFNQQLQNHCVGMTTQKVGRNLSFVWFYAHVLTSMVTLYSIVL